MAQLLPAKPADLYLGVVDLFGVLIPGVVLASMASPHADLLFESEVISRPSGPVMTAAIYLIAGWVLGQLLRAAGELLDLTIYDGWYVPGLKRRPRHPPSRPTSEPSPGKAAWRVGDKLRYSFSVLKPSFREAGRATDPLMAAARSLAKNETGPLRPLVDPDNSNEQFDVVPLGLFAWVQVEVARSDPAAAAAADRLTADSKFFRSLFFVAVAGTLLSRPSATLIIGLAGFSVASLVAYCRFRWKATNTLYRSYVQLRLASTS